MMVTSSEAAAYRAAVDDNGALYDQGHLVPSMAVAALVMGAAMRAVDLPAGAVHTGQELEFALPVPEQAELNCTATVSQNSVRGGTRFLVIGIQAALGGKTAVAGRATIAIAEEAA
jgi:hypothetical protein